MSWAAAIGAGGAVVGGLLGGGGADPLRPMEHIPKALRDDYLRISGGVEDLVTPEYYGGQLIAGQNPAMQNALQGMAGFGQEGGFGNNTMNSMYNAGQVGLGGVQGGMDYLQGMQERGPNQFQYDQGTYDQSFGNLSGGLQNAFDAGARGIQQNFDWNQLPGLNMQNALGGGQGNTKFGQAGALGQAQANSNIQNFGSNLWMNAANQANQGAMQAGQMNLNAANGMDSAMMQGYGQMGQLGGQLTGQAYDMGVGNLGLGLKSGQIQQGYDQSLIDAAMQKHNFEQNAPWIATQQKLNMLPSPGQPTQGTPGANPFLTAMQGAQAGLGLYDAYQGSKGGGGTSSTANLPPIGW